MTVEQFKGARGLPVEIRALEEVRDSFTVAEYRNYVDSIITLRVRSLTEVINLIQKIDDPFPRKVLLSYYSERRKTFYDIADEQHYCLRTVTRAYKAGIDDLIGKGLLTDAENAQEMTCERVSE